MLATILKSFKWSVFLTLSLVSQAANAGFVTIHETDIDAIFSQPNFGSTPIDIRFLTATEYVAPSLLSIDSSDDFNALNIYTTSTFSSTRSVLPMFFLDDISFCSVSNPSIVGCAATYVSGSPEKSVFGSFSIFESNIASGSSNDELLSHELAHNLGLDHIAGTGTNLMNPSLFDYGVGIAPLTVDQVNSIFNFGSNFIQQDSSGYFIQIAPIAIVASITTTAVPEPQTYLMFGIGFMVILISRKRIKTNQISKFNY